MKLLRSAKCDSKAVIMCSPSVRMHNHRSLVVTSFLHAHNIPSGHICTALSTRPSSSLLPFQGGSGDKTSKRLNYLYRGQEFALSFYNIIWLKSNLSGTRQVDDTVLEIILYNLPVTTTGSKEWNSLLWHSIITVCCN